MTRFFDSFPELPRNKNGEVVQQRTVDFLTYPIYAGYICSERYGLNWLKGQHEPLISLEIFDKVQARREGATYAPKRTNIGDDFVLRGIATCACCGTPLRSSWSKGLTKRYAYYLCQTKGCEAYGKSIPRAKIEGEVGELVKDLTPTRNLITVATEMFKQAWTMRTDQAKAQIAAGKRQVAAIEKEIEHLLTRIMGASNATVITAYENKLASLERDKAKQVENLSKSVPPKQVFDEKLELALRFLSNPWKLWESGNFNARRMVLKLAFAGPI